MPPRDFLFFGRMSPEKGACLAAQVFRAETTLMPIQWDKPFGLVMIEPMACGPPVAPLRNGSVPEIVDHGVTDDLDALAWAVERVDAIDPAACRAAVEARFSTDAVVSGYEGVDARAAD